MSKKLKRLKKKVSRLRDQVDYLSDKLQDVEEMAGEDWRSQVEQMISEESSETSEYIREQTQMIWDHLNENKLDEEN